jgi:hypothetical protein
VNIELGPYSSEAARAWLTNARQLLQYAGENRTTLPFNLPPEIIDTFHWFLDEWQNAAEKSAEFRWSGDVDADDMRKLLTYWLNLANVANESAEFSTSPEPARAFYPSVVGELIDSLEDQPGHDTFCGRVRKAWPGLGGACYR